VAIEVIEILQAIFLGVVEGVTEFLPISSTGHLLVAEDVIGYRDSAKLFTVVIQGGAVIAALWYFRHQIWGRITDLFLKKKDGWRFWILVAISCMPAAVAGLLLNKLIDSLDSLYVIAASLFVGGVVFLLLPKPKKTFKHLPEEDWIAKMTYVHALQIGFFQTLALIPGVSRSGATIVGGISTGLEQARATEFSFYSGVPLLLLATAFKLVKGKDDIAKVPGGSLALIAGSVTTAIVAFVMVTWLLRYVQKHGLRAFGWYRIFASLGLMVYIFQK
jgi:undecaprenyl-diphosphatase